MNCSMKARRSDVIAPVSSGSAIRRSPLTPTSPNTPPTPPHRPSTVGRRHRGLSGVWRLGASGALGGAAGALARLMHRALDWGSSSADPNAFPDRHAFAPAHPCHVKTRVGLNANYLL